MTIEDRLLAVMREIKGIEKNRKNEEQGWVYRGIDDVYNELHGLFAKHGILIIPEVLGYKTKEREVMRRDGRKSIAVHIYVQVKYNFIDESGDRTFTTMSGEGIDTGDKGLYKALSGAQKYLLLQMFLIPTESISEPEQDSFEIVAEEKESKKESSAEKAHENSVQKTGETAVAFGELLTQMANAETKEALKAMYIDAVRLFRDKDKINKIVAVKDLRMSQLDGAKAEKQEPKRQEKQAEKVKEEQDGIFF